MPVQPSYRPVLDPMMQFRILDFRSELDSWIPDQGWALARRTDEVTGNQVPAADVSEQRLLLVRARLRPVLERTAGPERAARRRLERARDVTLEHDPGAI